MEGKLCIPLSIPCLDSYIPILSDAVSLYCFFLSGEHYKIVPNWSDM
jgi:hypothetical protein